MYKSQKMKALLAATGAAACIASGIANAETSLYGFVRADFVYDSDADLGVELAGANPANLVGVDGDAQFSAFAETSRIGISHKGADYEAKVEGDFVGGDFRLRHAYGRHNKLTIGQAWSTFMDRDWVSWQNTVDFTGSVNPFARKALLRYSEGDFDLAIEEPNASIRGATSVKEPLPDFVARYTGSNWYVSAIVQSAEADGGTADGASKSVFGYSFGKAIDTGPATIKFNVTGNASNNVLWNFGSFPNPTFTTVGTNIEAVESLGYSIGVQSGGFNVSYGVMEFDEDYLTATDVETITVIHANYSFKPTKNVTYMFEVSNLDVERFDESSGDNTRYQFGAQYDF